MAETQEEVACVFCTKTTSATHPISQSELPRFFLIFSHFFHIQLPSLDLIDEELFSCNDCFKLVESFGNLFVRWESLRVHMEWKMRELFEIMKEADSSRANELDDDSNTVNQNIQNLRDELLQGYQKELICSMPEVILKEVRVMEVIEAGVRYVYYFSDDGTQLKGKKYSDVVVRVDLLEQFPLEATDNDTDGEATIKAETMESESPPENEELKLEPDGIVLNEESIHTIPETTESQITEQNTAGPTEPQNEEGVESNNSAPETSLLSSALNMSVENPPDESQQQLDKYICGFDGCTQSYSRKVNLENHRMTHYGDELLVCDWPDCGLVFGTEEYLQGHVQTHTTPESPYFCFVCQKPLPTPVFLSMHLATHEVYGETTLEGSRTQSPRRYNTRDSCRASNANAEQSQQSSAFSTDIRIGHTIEPDQNGSLSNVTSNQETPTTSGAAAKLMSSTVVGKDKSLKQKLIDAKLSRKRKMNLKN